MLVGGRRKGGRSKLNFRVPSNCRRLSLKLSFSLPLGKGPSRTSISAPMRLFDRLEKASSSPRPSA